MGTRGAVAARGSSARKSPPRNARRSARRKLPTLRPAALLAIACAIAVVTLGVAPLLPVSAVEVRGARHVTTEMAITASGLSGMPIFRASTVDARAGLRRLAAVRDAHVEVGLPDTVRIVVTERVPVGRWIGAGLEWFVDGEGVVFGSVDPTAAPTLRVRDERVAPGKSLVGERLDPALVAAGMRLAVLAPGEIRPDLVKPEVVMTSGPSGLVLRSGSGWEIRFGAPDRVGEKLSLASRLLRDDPTRRLDYLDVRSPEHVVISPQ